eukprot:TRINITY_DN9003_c1_g1_i1.p1 TRINITY_DN9003_c1_g1~~TRINITY_DN9003_c1_g1_i1.p1  ORF type:complete len:418 (+),score=28.11 TRINITY_DN9003_c1_g1_i1:65-1255(+)
MLYPLVILVMISVQGTAPPQQGTLTLTLPLNYQFDVINEASLLALDPRIERSVQCLKQEAENAANREMGLTKCWEDQCICRGGVWLGSNDGCSHKCYRKKCPSKTCKAPPSCNPKTGDCEYTDQPDGTPCGDDGSKKCYFGSCVPEPKLCGTTTCPFDRECVSFSCKNTTCIEHKHNSIRCLGGTCASGLCNKSTDSESLCKNMKCPPVIHACRKSGGCENGECLEANQPDGLECSDFSDLTFNDTCLDGSCVGKVTCTEPRTNIERTCTAETPECSTVSCRPDGSCVMLNKPDGTPCSDSSLHTESDACLAGVCVGAMPYYNCPNHQACIPSLLICLRTFLPACIPTFEQQCLVLGRLQKCDPAQTEVFCSKSSLDTDPNLLTVIVGLVLMLLFT